MNNLKYILPFIPLLGIFVICIDEDFIESDFIFYGSAIFQGGVISFSFLIYMFELV